MVLRVLDPIAQINKPTEGKSIRSIESLEGKRIGFLWSRHVASIKFWPAFEEAIRERFKPSEVVQLYKPSTWNPAAIAKVEELASKVDYAFVGVGA